MDPTVATGTVSSNRPCTNSVSSRTLDKRTDFLGIADCKTVQRRAASPGRAASDDISAESTRGDVQDGVVKTVEPCAA